MSYRVLSLYSGVSSMDRALPPGYEVVAFCESAAYPRKVLALRYPGIPVYESDEEVTGERLTRDGIGPIHMVIGGPPCFVAGTPVLTAKGYVPIEHVRVGDDVLTHAGRWQRVTNTMATLDQPVIRVGIGGSVPLTVTGNHPFYARLRRLPWDNALRTNVRVFDSPTWVAAANLGKGHSVGMVLPPTEPDDRSPEMWWVIGRYLADGWRSVRYHRHADGVRRPRDSGAVVICCAREERVGLDARLRNAGLSPYWQEYRTASKAFIYDAVLFRFLAQFGSFAHGKCLTRTALSLQPEKANALLQGYLSGDGAVGTRGGVYATATTVSVGLALTMALVAQRVLGVVPGVYETKVAPFAVIEGRTVRQKPQYKLLIPTRNRVQFVEGCYGWRPVRDITPAGRGTVYNISVAGDESYVAGGAIVHNCQEFSMAGKRLGAAGARNRFPEYLRIVRELRPRWCVAENVAGLRSADNGRYLGAILWELADMGYRVGWGHWRAADAGAPHRRERIFIVGRLGDSGELVARGAGQHQPEDVDRPAGCAGG